MSSLKEKLLQKSNLWHVGAVLLFVIVASIYFYPGWSGYTVEQGDVTNWVGASQEIKDYRDSDGQPGWTNAMFSGMPSTQISMTYPGRDVVFILKDAFTLWLPRPVSILFLYFISFYLMCISFKMKPLVAATVALAFGFSSSHIIIIEAGHLTKAFAIGFAPLLVAGMMFAYRWKNWILGVGLSALFMAFQLSANHLQITYYMAFVLMGVGIIELIRQVQVREKKGLFHFLKVTGGLLVAYAIAFMVNFGNITGTNEYAKYTTRGGTDLTITADGSENKDVKTSGLDREYITAWSYGIGETFTFIVPNFKGGETMRIADNEDAKSIVKGVKGNAKEFVKGQNQYWGDQPFTSGPVYLGVIVIFLALLGLIYSKDPLKWALLAVTIITVMLSWGKNLMGFTDFFIDVMPGYNKFRAVTIILCVAQLCVPLLGAMFLSRLIKERDKIMNNMQPFYIASGAIGLLLAVFLAVPGAFNNFTSVAEQEALANITDGATFDYYADLFAELENARISIFRADVLRSFAFFLLAFAAIFFYIRKVLTDYAFFGILALLLMIDLGGIDKRYLGTEKKGKNYEQWTETWKQQYPYQAGNGDLEIFNLEAQANPNLIYAVDSALNTIDFSKMESGEKKRVTDWVTFRTLNRYTNYRVFDYSNPFNSSTASYFHKSVGGYHGAKLGRYQELIEFHIGANNPSVMDMLNVKYHIASSRDQSGNYNSQFVKQNPTAMGNAWFTKSVKTVPNADEEILSLQASAAATLTVGDSPFPVYVNGQEAEGTMMVQGPEAVYFLVPNMAADGTVVYDTVNQTLPVAQAEAFDLSLIPGQQPGTWNWAYDAMLDSSFSKIMTLKASGRIGWDPNLETVVAEDQMKNVSQSEYSGEGTIVMSSYHPDNLIYKSSTSEPQLAVFSEIYYPLGWKAFVDGKETPISRVNYTLRAIEVPAGEHTIEFVYDLPSFKRSGTIAWTGTILILLIIGLGLFLDKKMPDLDDEEKEESPADVEVA